MDPFASVPADRPLDELFREPFDEPFDDFSDDPFHRIFGTPDVTEADGYYPSVLRDGKQSLGLGENYVPGWRPPHAIREYHQNWFVTITDLLARYSIMHNASLKLPALTLLFK